MVTPVPASALCTARKSTARLSRHETRCMAMAAPLVWMEMITPMKRNAGSRDQKEKLKSRPSPGDTVGGPIQGASITLSMS